MRQSALLAVVFLSFSAIPGWGAIAFYGDQTAWSANLAGGSLQSNDFSGVPLSWSHTSITPVAGVTMTAQFRSVVSSWNSASIGVTDLAFLPTPRYVVEVDSTEQINEAVNWTGTQNEVLDPNLGWVRTSEGTATHVSGTAYQGRVVIDLGAGFSAVSFNLGTFVGDNVQRRTLVEVETTGGNASYSFLVPYQNWQFFGLTSGGSDVITRLYISSWYAPAFSGTEPGWTTIDATHRTRAINNTFTYNDAQHRFGLDDFAVGAFSGGGGGGGDLPETASLVLTGSGLILGGILRRRRAAA